MRSGNYVIGTTLTTEKKREKEEKRGYTHTHTHVHAVLLASSETSDLHICYYLLYYVTKTKEEILCLLFIH